MPLEDWEIELGKYGFQPVDDTPADNFTGLPDATWDLPPAIPQAAPFTDFEINQARAGGYLVGGDGGQATISPPRRRRTGDSLRMERDALNAQDTISTQPDYTDPAYAPQTWLTGDENNLGLVDRVGLGLGDAGQSLKGQYGGAQAMVGLTKTEAENQALQAGFNAAGMPGVGLFARILGSEQGGLRMTREARAEQQKNADLGDVNGPSILGDVAQEVTSETVGSAVPSVAAGLVGGFVGGPGVGMASMIAASGLQSGGGFMDQSVQGWMDQGYSEDDAVKMARPIAILVGATTAGLTKVMGHGTEKLVQDLVSGAVPKAVGFKIIADVVWEALKEFPEEFADQVSQGVAERFTYNPEKPLSEIFWEAVHAGFMGAGIGTGVGMAGAGLHTGLDASNQRQTARENQAVNDSIDAESRRALIDSIDRQLPSDVTQAAPITVSERERARAQGLLVPDSEALTGLTMGSGVPTPSLAPVSVESIQSAEPDYRQSILDETMRTPQTPTTSEATTPIIPADAVQTPPLRRQYTENPQAYLDAGMNGQQAMAYVESAKRLNQMMDWEPTPAQSETIPSNLETTTPVSETIQPPTVANNTTVETAATKPSLAELEAQRQQAALKPSNEVGASRARRPKLQTRNQIIKDGRVDIAGPDVMDELEGNVGKLRRWQKGDPEDYKGALQAAEKMFPNQFSDNGLPLDEAQSALEYDGKSRRYESTDDFLNAIVEAGQRRLAYEQRQTKAFQEQDFQAIAVRGERKDQKKIKPIMSNTLSVGDEFKVQGKPFVVDQVKTDPNDDTVVTSVVLEDDKKFGRQEVGPGVELKIDKRSFKSAAGATEADAMSFGSIQEPGAAAPAVAPVDQTIVRGVPAIIAHVQQSTMSPDRKTVAVRFLGNEVFKRDVFKNLQWKFDDNMNPNLAGSRNGFLVTLRENGGDPSVAPEELLHVVYDMLPESDKAIIEAARLKAMPATAPVSIRSGTMTTDQFIAAKLPIDLYRYRSGSEFMAQLFADKAVQESLPAGMWERIQQVFNALVDAVKGAFGRGDQMEALRKRVLTGEFTGADPAVGQQIEGSLTKSRTDPENFEKLSKTETERKTEGQAQLAQGADIFAFLGKHGVTSLANSIQQMFGVPMWAAINAVGERLNGAAATYQSIMADPSISLATKTSMKREAGKKVLWFKEKREQILARATAAQVERDGPAIRKLESKLARAEDLKDIRAAGFKISRDIIKSAMTTLRSQLNESRNDDIEVAELEGELKAWTEASESGVAMERLMDDVVSTLLSTTDGETALETATPRDIISIYRRTKDATGLPLAANSPALLRMAGVILNKSSDVRNALEAATFARDAGTEREMSSFDREIVDAFAKNPVSAMMRLIDLQTRRMKDVSKAQWTWMQLRKPLMRRINFLQRQIDAGRKVQEIESDPAFRAHEAEVLKGFEYMGPKRLKAYSGNGNEMTYTGPDGISVDMSAADGPKFDFNPKSEEIEAFMARTRDWLDENPDDPDWAFHNAQLQLIEAHHANTATSVPHNRQGILLFHRAWSILNKLVDNIGGRTVAGGKIVLNKLDAVTRITQKWVADFEPVLTAAKFRAFSAHGIKWGLSKGRVSLATANEIYNERVMNELLSSQQRQDGGYQVGDRLDSGEVVTAQDMAVVKIQSEGASKLQEKVYTLIGRTIEESSGVGKAKAFRAPLKTRENLAPRRFNYDLASEFDERTGVGILKGFRDAYKAFLNGGESASKALEAKLNYLWGQFGIAFLSDRDKSFSKATRYDEGAFDSVRDEMIDNRDSVPDIDTLANRLSELTDATPEEAKQEVLKEFGRMVNSFVTATVAAENESTASQFTSSGTDPRNSFTQSRAEALAPYPFYVVGFQTAEDIVRHSAAAKRVGVAHVIDWLDNAENKLETEKTNLKSATDELKRQGVASPEKEAIKANKIARKQRETTLNFDDIESRLAQLRSIREHLRSTPVDNDLNTVYNRTVGSTVGLLVANSITALHNLLPVYAGAALASAGGANAWVAGLVATGYSWTISAALGTSAMTAGMGWGMWKLLTGIPKGWKNAPEGKALRSVYAHALGEWINWWQRDAKRLIKILRDAEASGVIDIEEDPGQKFINAFLGGLLDGGRLLKKDIATGHKVVLAPFAGLFESFLLPFLSAPFPTIGDVIQNTNILTLFENNWVGPKANAKPIIRMFNVAKGGGRAYDFENRSNPVNSLTAFDMDMSEKRFNDLITFHQDAGLDFGAIAHRFVAGLQDGKMDGLYTAQELNALKRVALERANIRAESRSVQALQDSKNQFAKPLSALQGWSSRTAGMVFQMLSIPEAMTHGKLPENISQARMQDLKQSMIMVSMILLPFLLIGGVDKWGDDEWTRIAKRAFFNQETARRRWFEEEGAYKKAAAFARGSIESIPYLGIIANMVNPSNAPARANLQPSFVALNMAQGVGEYLNTVLQTGDPFYGLPQLVKKVVPDSAAIINRLESQEGTRDRDNMVALAKRLGPQDLVRKAYGGGTPNLTELTPYGKLLQSYAMSGNDEKLRETYAKAVEVATKLGKPDPEKLVAQLFQARNPINAAFTNKLTPTQHADLLAKMNDSERATFLAGEAAFARGAEVLGIRTPTFQKASDEPRSSASSGLTGASRASRATSSASTFGTAAPRRASVSSRTDSRRVGASKLRARTSRVRSTRLRRPSRLRRTRRTPSRR